jgi:STE24 endopeptidase
MAVPVSKHLVTLRSPPQSQCLGGKFAPETPAQTASPAIAGTLSSLERAAGVTDPGYSSPAVVADTKSLDPAAATKAWLATVPRDQREKSDAYFEGGLLVASLEFSSRRRNFRFSLESRISARLRISPNASVVAVRKLSASACYAIPYFVIVATLSFPLNLYEHFFANTSTDLPHELFFHGFASS